ncbi:MAG: radical protein [Candidatus Midichloriaceae bacterium]|jgi:glycosyltransferase involved in cell wall biosynthesis/MoaA/NifB/PqqE/SkfB family radical SAM enzyme|nr:radical protein [Candidatus Midichloriaceae bacterium]
MKILKVIHGYPPRYSAGSEVYSQILAHELANNHEVQIFTRQENSFTQDYYYTTELDAQDPRILIHLLNIPRSKYRDQYVHLPVETKFKEILNTFSPDVVHFGHLNHLSINLPRITKELGIPSIFTLHDFWLMCPRGQFIQRNSNEPWALCDGQEDLKCASQCYRGSFSGDITDYQDDLEYWRDWIHKRMSKARSVIDYIDHFISPSQFLTEKFIKEFYLAKQKVTYLDYGFNLKRLNGRKRVEEPKFVFGYIGTHTPQKGIHNLIEAFIKLKGEPILRIWGTSKDETTSLKAIAASNQEATKRIVWMGGYDNSKIVEEVFNKVDAIVVPSIWGENSPLVIHEAQQAGVAVLTANYGGMSEYVTHMKNGLLFKHRDTKDLTDKMQEFVDKPELAQQLGGYGYLFSNDRQVPDITEHVTKVEGIYNKTLTQMGKKTYSKPGPWRITFDTNPDHCNYQCIMCECFSPYSQAKDNRLAQNKRKRIMPIETIEKILSDSVGTPLREIIPSTMGEPLLYKDFDRIIELCHKYNLKLNLTTNGSFPIKGVAKWAELLIPILSDIKISWNGATKDTHEKIMLGSKWDQVLPNLKEFIKARDESTGENKCTITLQLTFLEENVNELPDIIALAIDLNIDRVKGHHLWAHFDEIKNQSMRRSKESIAKWNQIVHKVLEIANNKKLKNGKLITLENISFLDENAVHDLAPGGLCPFLGKEAWINTEGVFSPCCAPDNLRKSLGNFGNINEQSLQEIWSSSAYNDLRKTYLSKELCKGCNMRKPLVT